MGLDPELLALFHEIEHCGVESVFRVGCLSQAPWDFVRMTKETETELGTWQPKLIFMRVTAGLFSS